MIQWNLRSLWFWSLRFRQLRIPSQKFRSYVDFALTREQRSAPGHLGTSVWQLAHLSIIILLGVKALQLCWLCVDREPRSAPAHLGTSLCDSWRTSILLFFWVKKALGTQTGPWNWRRGNWTRQTSEAMAREFTDQDDWVNAPLTGRRSGQRGLLQRERLHTDRPSLCLWWNSSIYEQHKYPDWMHVYVISFMNK